MPQPSPTREEILEQIKADVRLELRADPLRRSPEYALSIALMGVSKSLYELLGWFFLQLFPDTAEEAFFWRWFAIFGETAKPAVGWQGTYRFTGTNGTAILTGRQLTRSDGQLYRTTADITIGTDISGQAIVAIEAVNGGAITQNDGAQPLALASPLSGVDNAGTVQSSTRTGTDAETAQEALLRLLLRLREPPSGGGPGDWVRWALEVEGVTRAWEYPLLFGSNTVGVAFVRDNDGTGADVIPDPSERAEVQAYIESKRPVVAHGYVVTLTPLVVDFNISALDPDTVSVRLAIRDALADYFSRGDPDSTMPHSQLDNAISQAAGESSHVLNSPAGDVVSTKFQLPVLGTITFV